MKTLDQKKLDADKEFGQRIQDGSDEAWAEFVERFTDWVFYHANKWTRREALSSLAGKRKTRNATTANEYEYSEEALDAYLWIFGQLRNKLEGYTGKKGASLSSFVWAVLNSKYLFIDFLRWRYSNPHYLPAVIQKSSKQEQRIFVLLRMQKPEDQIAAEVELSVERVLQIKEQILSKLIKSGQEHLLLRPITTALDDEDKNLPASNFSEEHLMLEKVIMRFVDSLKKLSPEEIQLLQMFYNQELDAKEILSIYQRIDLNLPSQKAITESSDKDVYKAVEKIKRRLLVLFQQECRGLREAIITTETVNTFLQQLGVNPS